MSAAMFLLFYVFASFGVAFVLGYSKITLPLRQALAWASELHLAGDKIEDADVQGYSKPVRWLAGWTLALLECPACLAFWIGVASIYTPVPDFLPFSAPDYALAPILGFANLGAVLSLGLITNLIRTE